MCSGGLPGGGVTGEGPGRRRCRCMGPTGLPVGRRERVCHQPPPTCPSLTAGPWAMSMRYRLPPTWTSTCTGCAPVT